MNSVKTITMNSLLFFKGWQTNTYEKNKKLMPKYKIQDAIM